MKSGFIKGLSTALAVTLTLTSMALPVFGADNVTISHNTSSGKVTATRNDGKADRIALAQFDKYGKMTGFSVSPASSPTTVSNDFSFDPNYTTKVMTFSDFDTATAYEEYRVLGSKTLFMWDGENRRDASLNSCGGAGGFDHDKVDDTTDGMADGAMFGYEESSGTFRATTSGDTKSRHIHMYPESVSSDWIVYDFDLLINSNVASSSCYNKDIMTMVLYGGVTERTKAENEEYKETGTSTWTGAYQIFSLHTKRSGWFLSYSYGMQYGVNAGRLGEGGSYTYTDVSAGTTLDIQLAVNQRDRYAKLYVEDSLAATIDMSATTDEDFELRALRFRFPANVPYDIKIDNMYVYEGAVPRTENVSTEIVRNIILNGASVLDGTEYADIYNDSLYASQIGTTKAVHANTGVVWDGSKKVMLKNTPFENNGVQMVPVDELQAALGMSCQSTANAVERNGVTYVPIEDFLGSTAYTQLDKATHNPNCYVLKSGFTPTNVDNFNRWMLYYRPSETEVLADYNASDRAGEHPRILATQEDFNRIKEWYDGYVAIDANFDAYLDATGKWSSIVNAPWYRWMRNGRALANKRLDAIEGGELPEYEAYDTVGRMDYQRRLASDLHILAMWYQMTGEDRYAEAAWKCIEEVTKFVDFNMTHMLDVSEAQAAMAIGYDWLYDYWAEYDANHGTDRLGQMEKVMYNNGLFFSWDGYENGGMLSGEFLAGNNHGTVGNNGAMMLAVALMDKYPEECSFVISQAIKCQEINIWQWNTGMWYEGAGYWELTMQHTAKFVETLEGIFPGGYGFGGLEGLSEAGIAEVQHHTPLGIYNYGDNDTQSYWVPELIWLANEYNQKDLAYYVRANLPSGWSNNTYWHGEDTALALLWLNNETDAITTAWDSYTPEDLSLDYCNDEVDVAIMRDTHDSATDYTVAGFKGGQANETHAQIDAGSFIFESDGIRWAQDPGAGTYLSGYFDNGTGGERWKQLPARGEAHSTLIVNPPSDGTEDQIIDGRAEITGFTPADNGVIATVDMSKVLFNVSAATRGFFFTDNRQSLVIRDEFTPSAGGTAYWTMMLPEGSTVTDDGNGRITVVYNNETLYVDYVITGGTVGTKSLVGSNFQPINSTNITDIVKTNGQIRIPVTITNGTATTITVKLTPATATNTTAVSAYISGISSWSL